MKQMKSLRCTTCMLSTVQYQSTILAMFDERSTKCANSDGAIGLESRVRDWTTESMDEPPEWLGSLRPCAQPQQPSPGVTAQIPRRKAHSTLATASLHLDAGVVDHL